MKKLVFLNILVTLLLYSCFNEETPIKLGELTLPLSRPYAMVPSSILIDNCEVLVVQSFNDKSLHYFIIDSSSLVSYGVMDISKTINPEFFEIFIKDWDSVIVFNSQENKLLMYDSLGFIIYEYIPETEVAMAIIPAGLVAHQNAVLMSSTSNRLNVFNKNERKDFYRNVKPILEIGFDEGKGNKESLWGMFPTKYQEGNHIFLDYFPFVLSLPKSTTLVSYAYDDSIYVYKDGRIDKSYKCKSNFIKQHNPYPEDKQFDMVFYKDYLMFEPKYLKLLYNKYKDQYYRIAKHPVDTKSKNGNMIEEMEWSIIVMNSEFEVSKEVVFDYRYHSPELVLPSKNGVYISNAGGPDMSENVTMTLFKL
jgi:hypothetical protein